MIGSASTKRALVGAGLRDLCRGRWPFENHVPRDGLAFVGYNDAAANNASLPTFEAGDIAIVAAYTHTSTTQATVPAGWTIIVSGAGNSNAMATGYRVLQAGDTTTGTWTNATRVMVVVLRGQMVVARPGTPLGRYGQSGGSASPVGLAGVTSAQPTDGSSFFVIFAGSTNTGNNFSSQTVNDFANLGPSMTHLACLLGQRKKSFGGFSWTPSISTNWRTVVIEIRANSLAVEATTIKRTE